MLICFGRSRNLTPEVRTTVLAGLFCMALSPIAIAQSPAPVSSPILSQASQAFSGGKPVTVVEMTGTAHWTAGSTKDSGPVKLTAKITGENSAEFDLSYGTRIEKQSALAEDRSCTWSGKDGVEHDVASPNCWIATVWFLPHLALQNNGLPTSLIVQSAGAATDNGISSLHIRHQATFVPEKATKAYSSLVTQIQGWSKTDLVLDPSTMLPTVLKYNLHPDDNSSVNLHVEVRYNDYKNVSGVELPMHIERYVNGSLQVSVDLDSATVN